MEESVVPWGRLPVRVHITARGDQNLSLPIYCIPWPASFLKAQLYSEFEMAKYLLQIYFFFQVL